jgi:hypothetical protein
LKQVENDFGRQRLVTVSDDSSHAGHSGKLIWRALGIASGDDDLRAWVAAMRAANEGARGSVGLGCDGAGIHDDDIGGEGLAQIQSAQVSGDGLAVGAGGAAAEMFNVKAGHRFQCSAGGTRDQENKGTRDQGTKGTRERVGQSAGQPGAGRLLGRG